MKILSNCEVEWNIQMTPHDWLHDEIHAVASLEIQGQNDGYSDYSVGKDE